MRVVFRAVAVVEGCMDKVVYGRCADVTGFSI
jgi:hypothetical protein